MQDTNQQKTCYVCNEKKTTDLFVTKRNMCKKCSTKRKYEWNRKRINEDPEYAKKARDKAARYQMKRRHDQKLTCMCTICDVGIYIFDDFDHWREHHKEAMDFHTFYLGFFSEKV